MKRALLVLILFIAAAARADRTDRLLARALPTTPRAHLTELGSGIGIVFSPDLSIPGNCRFYTALGFACFESADWMRVLSDVNSWNIHHPEARIRTLILETHGTNGHGLKLQKGKEPLDERSYVSVAALQEILEPVGIRYVILSACNSGRLLRPEIYRRLNRQPGDKLFLPATLGIIDASDLFDPGRSDVTVITPASSHIETTLVGGLAEFAPSTRKALIAAAKARKVTLPARFAVSEMLIQMLLRDDKLELRTDAHVETLSKEQTDPAVSERIFDAFVARLDFLAAAPDVASGTALAAR